jgi:mersacidin/lichenicidin family type 2 lantibiotic
MVERMPLLIRKETYMSKRNIIRAWKDPVYRKSLSEAELTALPPNPAGSIELSDADLRAVAGGSDSPNTYIRACTSACTHRLTCMPN